MKKLCARLSALGVLIGLSAISTSAQACTDFRVTAKDGTVVVARSMEFALPLHSNLISSPRERKITTELDSGKPGMQWKNKYGYVFLDALNSGMANDGMNEEGLSFEYLYLPGETEYQHLPLGHEQRAIPYLQFGDWVLGNFKTVDEVKKALPAIYVVAAKYAPAGNMLFPLHASIYDKSGKGIVIEFIKGKMNVYDNTIGVLTNSPQYPWHIANLRNYVYLSPEAPAPIEQNGVTFAATGQGSGMMGLPGDISPPSRFVKTAALLRLANTPDNAEASVNLAEHIINNVDIPKGVVREPNNTQQPTEELTQWVVIKDLTHHVFYFRTYENLNLRSVSLDKVDFSPKATPLKMAIDGAPQIQDISSQFLMAKQNS